MASGIPVVIATNGLGVPVINTPNGAPAVVAENGFGRPVVVVENYGVPMNIQGLPPEEEE